MCRCYLIGSIVFSFIGHLYTEYDEIRPDSNSAAEAKIHNLNDCKVLCDSFQSCLSFSVKHLNDNIVSINVITS